MLKKIILMVALVASSLCFANELQTKPTLQEYQPLKDLTLLPLENKITANLIIRTPVPQVIAPNVVLYLYDKDKQKIITFASNSYKSFGTMLDGVFGLKAIAKDDEQASSFQNVLKNNQVQVIEIKLNKPIYRAFALITKRGKELYKYDIYILPQKNNQTDNNGIVRMITLDQFTKQEVEEILGTLRVTGG